ncbi:hypothetical protein ACTXT7_001486 [Hymenolepis weldensis]
MLFVRILYDNSSAFRPRSRSDLPALTLPSHLLSSSARSSFSLLFASIFVVAPLNTFWSDQLLVFCFTIVVSPYSNSYELVTVVAVASY